jgi:hypothetical protein
MSIATEAQKRGACPHCGAKLPDVPVSLCPYCASPLETKADREARTSVHTTRIGRIREHKDFAEALSWSPPEGRTHQQGRRLSWWGQRGAILGVALISAAFLLGVGRGWSTVLTLVGVIVLILGIWALIQGRNSMQRAHRFPLLKRPALILDRRSETRIRGWSGDTTYYFKLEFEDGAQGEFNFPGLGPQEDPNATNLPGVAYTRGQELLHFRHVRV